MRSRFTHANLMWGTDFGCSRLDDGWGWIFTAVEHWNADCRLACLQARRPLRRHAADPHGDLRLGCMALIAAGAARGKALRMRITAPSICRTTSPTSKFWGIQPSYAFVAEPQTNGVAERFNRTLKEQIIHGRIYRNIAELRDAVRDFVDTLQCPVDRRKERLPEPRSSSSGVVRRDLESGPGA